MATVLHDAIMNPAEGKAYLLLVYAHLTHPPRTRTLTPTPTPLLPTDKGRSAQYGLTVSVFIEALDFLKRPVEKMPLMLQFLIRTLGGATGSALIPKCFFKQMGVLYITKSIFIFIILTIFLISDQFMLFKISDICNSAAGRRGWVDDKTAQHYELKIC